MKHTWVKTKHVRGSLLSYGLKCQSPPGPCWRCIQGDSSASGKWWNSRRWGFSGEGAHWENTAEGLLVFCPVSFLAFWLSGGEKSFSKCFHYVCFTLSLKQLGQMTMNSKVWNCKLQEKVSLFEMIFSWVLSQWQTMSG